MKIVFRNIKLMKKLPYIMLAALMLLSSCGDKKFVDDIVRLQSRPIDMSPCDGAFCCEEGEQIAYDGSDSTYMLVIYIDSLSCSPCFISHMHEYEDVISEFDSLGVSTLFVFEPQRDRQDEVKYVLEQQAYPFRTVVVGNGTFTSANPHLPSSQVLHSFLLNGESEVVVVGNPQRNDRVRALMRNSVQH